MRFTRDSEISKLVGWFDKLALNAILNVDELWTTNRGVGFSKAKSNKHRFWSFGPFVNGRQTLCITHDQLLIQAQYSTITTHGFEACSFRVIRNATTTQGSRKGDRCAWQRDVLPTTPPIRKKGWYAWIWTRFDALDNEISYRYQLHHRTELFVNADW